MKKMNRFIATILVAVMLVTVVSTSAMADDGSREGIQRVQQALNDAGFDCGTPDGVAGEKTKAAMEYQEANGLEVTGEIDGDLLVSLFKPDEPEEPETVADTKVEAQTESQNSETVAETEEEIYLIDANGQYSGVTDEGNFFKWYSCKKIIFYMNDELVYEIGADNGRLVFGKLKDDMSFDEDTIRILSADPAILEKYAQLAYEVFGEMILYEEYFENNFEETVADADAPDYIEIETSTGTHIRWSDYHKLVYVANSENVYQISLLNGDLVFGKLNEDGESFKWYTSLTARENFPEIMESALQLIIYDCMERFAEDSKK